MYKCGLGSDRPNTGVVENHNYLCYTRYFLFYSRVEYDTIKLVKHAMRELLQISKDPLSNNIRSQNTSQRFRLSSEEMEPIIHLEIE